VGGALEDAVEDPFGERARVEAAHHAPAPDRIAELHRRSLPEPPGPVRPSATALVGRAFPAGPFLRGPAGERTHHG
jgi:hypothetical protein